MSKELNRESFHQDSITDEERKQKNLEILEKIKKDIEEGEITGFVCGGIQKEIEGENPGIYTYGSCVSLQDRCNIVQAQEAMLKEDIENISPEDVLQMIVDALS